MDFTSWDIGQYVHCNCLYVISFGIDLIFLIKLFFYMTKESRPKFKYFENEKSFLGEKKKAFFMICKGLSVVKICPRLSPLSQSCLRRLENKLPLFSGFKYFSFNTITFIFFSPKTLKIPEKYSTRSPIFAIP